MSRPWARLGPVAVIACVLAAACSSGGGGSKAGGATGGAQAAGKCPLGAIAKAPGRPVDIILWHAMTQANEAALTKLTDQFNGSQSDVRVKLVNQTGYDDTFTKFKAGLASGDLPDLVQLQDTSLQLMIDSRAILPAQACVDADRYDLSDHVGRVVDYYRVKNVLWPMPFNVSNLVLLYNKQAFTRAGLDPEKPPATLDEIRAASQKIVASGTAKSGIALKTAPEYPEQWLAKAGQPYVNNGNGRQQRATAVTFDNQTGLDVYTWLASMVKDKLAISTPNRGFDHLFAVANANAAMTIESSASLGTILGVIGNYPSVTLGVGAFPGPPGQGGVLVGGAALYIVNKSAPAKQEAAWRFAKFLDEPASQAAWSAGTGYVPIRKSAIDLDPIKKRWAEVPGFKVAYDQLVAGATNAATAGPVIGDYAGVRKAVEDALQAMVTTGTSPKQAIDQAAQRANAAIKDYNARVGG
jgi:sn-glycerol 3-phosphate transport system substrate-binding protein